MKNTIIDVIVIISVLTYLVLSTYSIFKHFFFTKDKVNEDVDEVKDNTDPYAIEDDFLRELRKEYIDNIDSELLIAYNFSKNVSKIKSIELGISKETLESDYALGGLISQNKFYDEDNLFVSETWVLETFNKTFTTKLVYKNNILIVIEY